MPTKTTIRALALAGAALAAAPAGWAQEKVDVHRSAAADGRVEIENLAGSTRVIGWDREEVTVSGTLGPGAEGLNVSGGGLRTRVEVETRGNPHAVRSDLEIHVPAASRVEVEAFSATVTVSGVAGSVRVESVNGSISVAGAREVDAETVGGGVEVSGPSRRIHAESVNGDVTVRGVGTELEASTVSGRLDVAGGPADRVRLETVAGRLRFDGELGAKATLDAESVSGEIELVLPATVAADFQVSTFSGEIENELGPAAHRTSKYTPEKELEFTTGAGGGSVSAKTVSGAIRLRKR